MLNNPFKNLERIIHMELLQKVKTFSTPPEEYNSEIMEILETDFDNIFNRINALRLDSASENEARWMAEAYQEKIDDLMGTIGIILNQLGYSINDEAPKESWFELVTNIIECLKGLMKTLLYRHSNLVNLYLPMSEEMKDIFMKEYIEFLHEELSELPKDSATYEVFKILLLPFEEPDECFLYFHIDYIASLKFQMLRILAKERKDEEHAILLRKTLWKMNFNHPTYVSILREEYKAYLDNCKGKERIKRCLEIRKDLRSSKPLQDESLYLMIPSIDKQLENWLNVELNCTRALLVTESIVANNPFVEFKVKTLLSIRQLAGILRILCEREVILNKDKRELLRFFSSYFIPASGKGFSLAALTRYYDQHKGDSVIQQIKGLLGPKDI